MTLPIIILSGKDALSKALQKLKSQHDNKYFYACYKFSSKTRSYLTMNN